MKAKMVRQFEYSRQGVSPAIRIKTRFSTREGHTVQCHVRSQMFFNESGRPSFMATALDDINVVPHPIYPEGSPPAQYRRVVDTRDATVPTTWQCPGPFLSLLDSVWQGGYSVGQDTGEQEAEEAVVDTLINVD